MSGSHIELVILRHGEAGSAESDFDRALTKKGRDQITRQYQWLQQQSFLPELILHSPYQRTVETALLSAQFFPDAQRKIEPMITPDASPQVIAEQIHTFGKIKILMISHMPMVAYLTVALLPKVDIFGFPLAGLCYLQLAGEAQQAKLLHKHWLD